MKNAEIAKFTRNMVILALLAIFSDILFDWIGISAGIYLRLIGDYSVSLGFGALIFWLLVMVIYCSLAAKQMEHNEIHVS
jgi:hypothetical protein